MVILTEIPEAEAREALDKIGDHALDARNAGTETTIRLSNGAGMWVRYVLCTQMHPEVREHRCRMEVCAKIVPKWRNRMRGK